MFYSFFNWTQWRNQRVYYINMLNLSTSYVPIKNHWGPDSFSPSSTNHFKIRFNWFQCWCEHLLKVQCVLKWFAERRASTYSQILCSMYIKYLYLGHVKSVRFLYWYHWALDFILIFGHYQFIISLEQSC